VPKSLIAYVDGFNLYNGMHDAFSHRYLWLDLVKLLQSLRPNHEILCVNFFTAPLLDDPDAQSRQATYWNALEATSGTRSTSLRVDISEALVDVVPARRSGTITKRRRPT
jgi:hypothetical protein